MQHAPGAMVSMTAMTVTHELGHVLSMEHDDEIGEHRTLIQPCRGASRGRHGAVGTVLPGTEELGVRVLA